MLKPICMSCKLFYRPKRNGTFFTEGMPLNDKWVPYKIWLGDLWECKGCNHQIIVGTGHDAVLMQHHKDFEAVCKSSGADQIQINDC